MQYEQIFSLIEEYRPLNSFSSLPFPKYIALTKNICWFNFAIEQSENLLTFSVFSLYTYSENQGVTETPLDLQISVTLTEYDEPDLTEEEYAERLESMSDSYTEESLITLFEQAVMSPLLPVYKAVLHHIGNN